MTKAVLARGLFWQNPERGFHGTPHTGLIVRSGYLTGLNIWTRVNVAVDAFTLSGLQRPFLQKQLEEAKNERKFILLEHSFGASVILVELVEEELLSKPKIYRSIVGNSK